MSEVKVNKITPTANCGTVTLGDSGDTITIPSGVTLTSAGAITNSGTITNTGTISGGTITGNISNTVSWQTGSIKTSGFTAVAGEGYFCDTSSGAFAVTLPASPSAGNLVAIKDYSFTADTANITINRNGSNIQGTANNAVISTEGASIFLIYVDATKGWLLVGAAKKADIAEQILFVTATGGNSVITNGDFKTHIFTGPGTFCVSCAGNPVGSDKVDYFVVAGGGGATGNNGGGNVGGGGGAGGFRLSNSVGCIPAPTMSPLANPSGLSVPATAYPITVGGGGAGGVGTPGSPFGGYPGSQGASSIFSTITSAGGGRADGSNATTNAGGSGGGDNNPGNVGTGNTPPVSPPQGNPGGGNPVGAGSPNNYSKGGGGGAGAAGTNATGSSPGAGPGGIGSYLADSVIGPTAPSYGEPGPVSSTRYYAGGGGGGIHNAPPGGAGSGGIGGGGDGVGNSGNGGNGVVNTGGGGGATGGSGYASCNLQNGGTGGSGIVIIRYKYQ